MPDLTFDQRLRQANGRLKAARVGVAIERIKDRLCLRAIFPPPPGAVKKEYCQRRLYLGIHANPKGLQEAEARAREIGAQLDRGAFSWPEREENKPTSDTQEILRRFEEHYFSTRARTPKTETTWKNYQNYIRKLPSELTSEGIIATIKAIPPDTRSRQAACVALGMVARFAGIEIDLKPYKGTYTSSSPITPREIPTDEDIVAAREKIPDPAWLFAYDLLNTYGLRNHEIWLIDMESLTNAPGIVTVQDGKTGGRRIWPCYPDWWDLWNLGDPERELPRVTGRNHSDLGSRLTQAFTRWGLSFRPYDCRHAWAIRSMEFGLDISLAAAQMGHSVDVHGRIYHHWISERHHQRAFDLIMSRPDRPRPPGEPTQKAPEPA